MSPCERSRTATLFSCSSRSPSTSMNGIFCNCSSRIFAPILSLWRLNSARLKPGCQCFFSFLPLLVCTKIQLAPIASLHRKFKLDFVEAERLQDLVSKINAIVDLARNLFRSAEQMSIVDSESPHAHQSMESSRQFGAIDSSHLGITLREIAIRTLLRFVNPDVHWAVHRL